MITIREIADNNTSISSTRWAFASVVKTDIALIVVTVVSGLIGHFIGKPLPESFYKCEILLLGVLTGIVAAPKTLQGFEPKRKSEE